MSIEVKPLTPAFGAEIEGVDLASSSAADFDEVLEIFSKYGVIFFVIRTSSAKRLISI